MAQTFGVAVPSAHAQEAHQAPARYLVIIEAAGSMVARLFLQSRENVAEFGAGSEEVAAMTRGIRPTVGAQDAEWDQALQGNSDAERAAAQVYTLDV